MDLPELYLATPQTASQGIEHIEVKLSPGHRSVADRSAFRPDRHSTPRCTCCSAAVELVIACCGQALNQIIQRERATGSPTAISCGNMSKGGNVARRTAPPVNPQALRAASRHHEGIADRAEGAIDIPAILDDLLVAIGGLEAAMKNIGIAPVEHHTSDEALEVAADQGVVECVLAKLREQRVARIVPGALKSTADPDIFRTLPVTTRHANIGEGVSGVVVAHEHAVGEDDSLRTKTAIILAIQLKRAAGGVGIARKLNAGDAAAPVTLGFHRGEGPGLDNGIVWPLPKQVYALAVNNFG